MQFRLSAGLKQKLTAIIDNQLALMAAILLDVSIRHLTKHSQSGSEFTLMWGQLLLESSPVLLAHYMAFKINGWRGILIWFGGFLVYPTLSLVLESADPLYAQWSLFRLQSALFLLVASVCFGLSRLVARRHNTKSMQFISRLFSLNSVMLFLIFIWSLLWAGVFVSTDDPVRNQPIQAVIHSDKVVENFVLFLHYWWQFAVIGAAVYALYWLNRYVLIRRILTKNGILAYVSGGFISIVLLTPVLATFVTWLPMNIPEFTFLPSQDYNVFAPVNFRFCFLLLAVSTPIILAFERQQQDKALAEIAQRQSQTELQLLQQQINPHFLFNTLNNLYALTLTGSKNAPTLVMQLANLLRYTVYEGQNQRVTLEQEINYIQDFLALQAIRSGDKCHISVRYPEQAEQWFIAPLLLIIIVENAFKHGVEPSQSACTINLSMHITEGRLLVKCQNSLPENQSKRPPGIGLENLRRRLALLYAGKHRLSAKIKNNEWHTELSLELEPCTEP